MGQMKETPARVTIYLRAPKLPGIIISKERLFAGTSMTTVATALMKAVPHKGNGLHVHW